MKLNTTLSLVMLLTAALTAGCGGDERCTCGKLNADLTVEVVCIDIEDSDEADACESSDECQLEDGTCSER